MFRDMRRKRQQLPQEEAETILREGTSGVLSLLGDEGYPYGVPLSYVYAQGHLYFHCATEGHKLDAIRREPKASFCVIGQDKVLPEAFTTVYRSVIVFGRVKLLEEESAILQAIETLSLRYSPQAVGMKEEIQKNWERFYMLEMTIDHMTGKEGIELTKQRRNNP